MFDVGFAELFLLALIGLLVLGPERLPRVASKIGSVLRQARQSWNVMKRTVEAEMARSGMDESVRQAQQNLRDIGRQVSDLPGALQDAASKPGPAAERGANGGPGGAAETPSAEQAGAEPATTATGPAAERTEDGPEGKPAAFTGPLTDPAPGNPATVPPAVSETSTDETGKGDGPGRE